MRRTTVSLLLSLLALFPAPSLALTSSISHNLRLGPPPGHHNLGNVGESTSSWIERTAVWEGAGSIEFDAFVDSQAGADRLEVSVDDAIQVTRSGYHQGGHISIPVGSGTHKVRFAYVKDDSTDEGLDTAWIDNAKFVSDTAFFEYHQFNSTLGCDIAGWTRGGHSGGWCTTLGPERREWRRPEAMAYVGYQAAPVTYGLARDLTWPSDTDQNELAIAYAVDCEADKDYFRVLIDGVATDPLSGRYRSGYLRLPVSGGTHHVVLEYTKDESVDEGYDEVRIRAMELRSRGVTIGYGGLDGSAVGEVPRGWQAIASANADPSVHWSASRRKVSSIQLMSNDNVRIADAALNQGEYQVTIKLQDAFAGLDSKLWLGSTLSEHFMVGLEFPPPIGDWFWADGRLSVMIDSMRPSVPYVRDCPPDVVNPGPSARRFDLRPTPSGNLSLTEQIGTCGAASGTWRDATPAESWPVAFDAQAGETAGSLYVELEIGVSSPAGLPALAPLAFGITADSPVVGGPDEPFLRYPDVGVIEIDDADVTTWRIARRWPPEPAQ